MWNSLSTELHNHQLIDPWRIPPFFWIKLSWIKKLSSFRSPCKCKRKRKIAVKVVRTRNLDILINSRWFRVYRLHVLVSYTGLVTALCKKVCYCIKNLKFENFLQFILNSLCLIYRYFLIFLNIVCLYIVICVVCLFFTNCITNVLILFNVVFHCTSSVSINYYECVIARDNLSG